MEAIHLEASNMLRLFPTRAPFSEYRAQNTTALAAESHSGPSALLLVSMRQLPPVKSICFETGQRSVPGIRQTQLPCLAFATTLSSGIHVHRVWLLATCPRTRTLRIPVSRDFHLDVLYLPHHDSRQRSPDLPSIAIETRINDRTVQGHGISNAYPAIQGVPYSGSDNPASHSQTLHLGSSIARADGKTGISISDRIPRRRDGWTRHGNRSNNALIIIS